MGISKLLNAIKKNNDNKVELLLQKSYNKLNYKGVDGSTPLHCAVCTLPSKINAVKKYFNCYSNTEQM